MNQWMTASMRPLVNHLEKVIKQQLKTSVRVLPPSVQFVNRKRSTLLESPLGTCGPLNDISLLLQSQAMSRSSEMLCSDQIFSVRSEWDPSTRGPEWQTTGENYGNRMPSADVGRDKTRYLTYALCPTDGATSPFAQAVLEVMMGNLCNI